jgi:methionyl-tRNA formyltransferase
MAGDAATGVTIHETVAELDAGPVAAQEAFPIGAEDDAGDVFARSAEVAARLLDGVLAWPEPRFRPQAGEPSYAEKIRPEDRVLDLARPAVELVRVVRALSPHIGARAELEGRRVTVWRARVGADGSFEALEVQPECGRRMDIAAWRRGLR